MSAKFPRGGGEQTNTQPSVYKAIDLLVPEKKFILNFNFDLWNLFIAIVSLGLTY